MITNRSHSSTSHPLRGLVRAILFIVCGIGVVAAIVHARDVDQAGSVPAGVSIVKSTVLPSRSSNFQSVLIQQSAPIHAR